MLGRQLLGGVVIGVSCAAAAAAAERAPSRLDVRAVVDIAVGPTCAATPALALAQRESSAIWTRAGVDLRWVEAADLPYAGSPSDWLVVQCAGNVGGARDERSPKRVVPIAAIRFIDARPTNTITVSVENARALLRAEEQETSGRVPGFAPQRELHLGRMLGRAIAHEVGHFLNESGEHTPRGLMRATHSVAALIGASLRPFAVDEHPGRGLQARRTVATETYEF